MTELPDVVQRARAALDGITPGPWHAEDRDLDDPYSLTTVYNVFHNGDTADRDLVAEVAYDNARFIAAAPDLVRGLLAEVEQLQAAVERLSRGRDEARRLAEKERLRADAPLVRYLLGRDGKTQ